MTTDTTPVRTSPNVAARRANLLSPLAILLVLLLILLVIVVAGGPSLSNSGGAIPPASALPSASLSPEGSEPPTTESARPHPLPSPIGTWDWWLDPGIPPVPTGPFPTGNDPMCPNGQECPPGYTPPPLP